MSWFEIDKEKLDGMVERSVKTRDEAFADYGKACVYMGAESDYAKDKMRKACTYAGLVDGVKSIQGKLDAYRGDEGESRFDSAYGAALRNASRAASNSRELYMAKGVEMAYRTVRDSCVVREMTLQEKLQEAQGRSATTGTRSERGSVELFK